MKRIFLSMMAIAAVALTSCKKDEANSTELGEATITGKIKADIDQTNDVNEAGLYNAYSNPENVEGMTVKVTVDTRNWVQAPEAGYNYDKKVYTAVTNADGEFTLTIPATEEGYNVTLTFEDKFGVTRKLFTNDGSELTEESKIYRGTSNVWVFAGANLNKVYDASITAVNEDANQYGTAKVYGTVYADMTPYSSNPQGYEKLTASATYNFTGKKVYLTWDYAPYDMGYETTLSFTIDAEGNYEAIVPTEMVGGDPVEFYLGMDGFYGDVTAFTSDFSADSTWSGYYELTNGDGLYEEWQDATAGQIITGVDLYFDGEIQF